MIPFISVGNASPISRSSERRVKKVRPSYLNPDVLERAAANAEARLVERVRKQRGE
ncbi:hypothetical protein D3C81_1568080 [compost metagenome]